MDSGPCCLLGAKYCLQHVSGRKKKLDQVSRRWTSYQHELVLPLSSCFSTASRAVYQAKLPHASFPAVLQPPYLPQSFLDMLSFFHRLWFCVVEHLCMWWPPEGAPGLRVRAVCRYVLNLANSFRESWTKLLNDHQENLSLSFSAMRVHAYVSACLHAYIHLCVCVCECACVCVCTVRVFVSVLICLCACMYVHVCVMCVHAFVHVSGGQKVSIELF